MSDYQTHTFNVMFEGTMDDLMRSLQDAGFQLDFAPPGLKGSQGTLIIEKTPQQTELENEQAKTCGHCDQACNQPWCVTKRGGHGTT